MINNEPENRTDRMLSRFMLIDLPPGFEAATHARNIFESVWQKVGYGSQTADIVITVNA